MNFFWVFAFSLVFLNPIVFCMQKSSNNKTIAELVTDIRNEKNNLAHDLRNATPQQSEELTRRMDELEEHLDDLIICTEDYELAKDINPHIKSLSQITPNEIDEELKLYSAKFPKEDSALQRKITRFLKKEEKLLQAAAPAKEISNSFCTVS